MGTLDPYREPFKAVVLKHICHSLPPSEWARLRDLALDRRHRADPSFEMDAGVSPAALLDAALCEDSISVDETLIPAFRANSIEVGQVGGQPVHYVSGEGIYVWGLAPAQGFSLSFWVTHPAYPPGW